MGRVRKQRHGDVLNDGWGNAESARDGGYVRPSAFNGEAVPRQARSSVRHHKHLAAQEKARRARRGV